MQDRMGPYQGALAALERHLVTLGALNAEHQPRGLFSEAFFPAIRAVKESGNAHKVSSLTHQILAQRRALPDADDIDNIHSRPGAKWDFKLDDIVANIVHRAGQELEA